MRIILATSFLLPFALSAASFDCTKATKSNEKLICGSTILNSLDEKLSDKYKTAVYGGDYTLRADQIRWLKSINKNCKSEQCLTSAYIDRIKYIESWNVQTNVDKSMIGNFEVAHPVDVVNNEKKEGYETDIAHDCLSISKINKDTIKFSINSVGTNAHLCSMSGTATLKDGKYYYNKGSDNSDVDSSCALTITNRENSILINDPHDACKEFSCGARAGLDQLTYSKNITTKTRCEVEY